jgi:hypothetical protein
LQEKSDIFDDMETARRHHGDHGVITRSYGVLIGDCLRSDCACTAFFALPLRFHGAYTALSLRSHCADIVLHVLTITHSELSYPCCNCMQASNI